MKIRIMGLCALTVSAFGCGSPPAPSAPSTTADPIASSSPAPSVTAEPAAPTSAAPPSSAPAQHEPSQGVDLRGADWTPAVDGVEGWLQSKGIQDTSSGSLSKLAGLPDSTHVECDRVVPVGKPVGEAALCRRQDKDGLWVLATSFLLLVPDNGRLRKVWEAPSAVGQLSRRDVSETPFVQLNVSLQDDGALLFLEEAEGLGCSDYRARVAAARKDADPEEKDTFTALERLAARVCQAKGRYAWRGTTFGR